MDIKKRKLGLFPPPWNLTGSGYMLIYRFTKNFINHNVFLNKRVKNNFCGGFGAVMLVDYHQSDAGPYQELLFIPGKVRYKTYKKNMISRIYVSTKESAINGRINWGIPKEYASFDARAIDKNTEVITVKKNRKNIFKIKLQSGGFKFPVSTYFFPFPLIQFFNNKIFFTIFSGSGLGQIASIKEIKVDGNFFPDITDKKPIFAIKISNFTLKFPIAKTINIHGE